MKVIDGTKIFENLGSFLYSEYNYYPFKNKQRCYCRNRAGKIKCRSFMYYDSNETKFTSHSIKCKKKISSEFHAICFKFKNNRKQMLYFIRKLRWMNKNEMNSILNSCVRERKYKKMNYNLIKIVSMNKFFKNIKELKIKDIKAEKYIKTGLITDDFDYDMENKIIKNDINDIKISIDRLVKKEDQNTDALFFSKEKIKHLDVKLIKRSDLLKGERFNEFEKFYKNVSFNHRMCKKNDFSFGQKISKIELNLDVNDKNIVVNRIWNVILITKQFIRDIFLKNSKADIESLEYAVFSNANNQISIKNNVKREIYLKTNEENDKDIKSGYGCVRVGITIDLMLTLGNLTNNSSVRDFFAKVNIKNTSLFNLSEKSILLDLGSGYGFPNITSFLLYNNKNYGIEVLDDRLKYSTLIKFSDVSNTIKKIEYFNSMIGRRKIKDEQGISIDKYDLLETNVFSNFFDLEKIMNFHPPIKYNLDKLVFKKNNIFEKKSIFEILGQHPSHIYCYGKLFENKFDGYNLLFKLKDKLNETRFKILIWTVNPKKCNEIGLIYDHFVYDYIGSTIGNMQNFKFYIYIKTSNQRKR
jgi:hypothetical protein